MVPMILDFDADDDFVRTLSDNDEEFPLVGDEDDGETKLISDSAPHSKKRKRSTTQEPAHSLTKKQKKEQKAQVDVKSRADQSDTNGVVGLGAVESEDAHGEDDGAMDSDFEFQIGSVETGVIEGFDGWGDVDGGEGTTVQKSGSKKGVDLDRLIAKRRKVGLEKVLSNGDGVQFQDQKGLKNDNGALEEEGRRDESADADANGGEEDFEDNSNGDDETLADDAFGVGADLDDDESLVEDDLDQTIDTSVSEDEMPVADAMPGPNDVEADSEEEDDVEEIARRKSFFAPEEPATKINGKEASPSKAFQSMNLSRSILRGLASVGFITPTPIQTKTIPIALLAKDVVGGAVTGSGKTGAFIIPILERLLHRPKKVSTTRVAILMPTRELAVQCFNVAKKLASFTDITFALTTGGFSLREQENGLRHRPDIIIATPGRFIDHMRNSPSFTIDTLEILVLDEADRMLEDGFADELNEILTTIPRSRQTMLFSATMTDRVDKLIRVGLNRPVRLMVDARKQTVVTLTQEIVRLRPGREEKRLGYLMHLCSDIFTERVIVFFRQKKEAHRVRVIFGLLGIKAAELHGSMSQDQRLSSLTSFRNGHSTHLLATDLASRGLDIPHVSVVLNYEAPQSHEIYLHRVGRTARAGRGGRACTIAAETDRKVVKQAVKAAKAQGAKIVSRVVDPAAADRWVANVKALDEEVEVILKDEKEEKLLNQTDMSIRKGENIIAHDDEIHARPRRTWFESEREKLQAKKVGKAELNGKDVSVKLKNGGKLSNKDKKTLDDKRERVEGRVWKKGKSDATAKNSSKGKSKGGVKEGKRGPKTGSKGSRADQHKERKSKG